MMVDKIPVVSESSIKKSVEDRLQIAQNQGQLLFLRLNAGDFIETRGESRRRIKGCPPGTADFIVLQGNIQDLSICQVTFLECKTTKGKTSKEQDEFAGRATGQDARYFVVRDAEEIDALLRFG